MEANCTLFFCTRQVNHQYQYRRRTLSLSMESMRVCESRPDRSTSTRAQVKSGRDVAQWLTHSRTATEGSYSLLRRRQDQRFKDSNSDTVHARFPTCPIRSETKAKGSLINIVYRHCSSQPVVASPYHSILPFPPVNPPPL